MQMLFEECKCADAVHLVRADKEFNFTILWRQTELGLVQVAHLRKFISDGFVRSDSVEVATLNHERTGCNQGRHL